MGKTREKQAAKKWQQYDRNRRLKQAASVPVLETPPQQVVFPFETSGNQRHGRLTILQNRSKLRENVQLKETIESLENKMKNIENVP